MEKLDCKGQACPLPVVNAKKALAGMGEGALEELVNIKSREELIGDIVALLQSPAKNVISALQGSAGQKIAGLVKTLEARG